MAVKSLRVSTGALSPRFRSPVTERLIHTKGASSVSSTDRQRTVKGAKACQYTAPRVFGTISESTRIARVMAAGTITPVISGFESAQIAEACWPTPMAPTVWAMVLSVRIAARGRSTSALKATSRSPRASPA